MFFSLRRIIEIVEISAPMNKDEQPDLSLKYLANLHHGAKPSTFRNANKLRRSETQAEQKLWVLLRNRQLNGKKFRRQHAILNYVADFYCHESKLIIELDGNYHKSAEAAEYDQLRTAQLNEAGITVLRFWNEEIMNDPERVLERISDLLR